MRVCPVCHARAFDDAEICYGCMYRFGGKETAAPPMPGDARKAGGAGSLPQEPQARARASASGVNAASWADARQASLTKGRSMEQSQQLLDGDASGAERCLDEGCPEGVPVVAKNVSVSAGGADIVVRIELVGAVEADAAGEDDAARQAAQVAACQLLRRGRPIRGSVGARPADVQRGASAGQGAEQARSSYPRHAAEVRAVSA